MRTVNKEIAGKEDHQNVIPFGGADALQSDTGKLSQSAEEIRDLHNQLSAAMRSIEQLIKRVAELERSKYYRLKKLIGVYIKRLRSNFSAGGKKGFLSVLVHYLFDRGAKVGREILAKILRHTYLFVEPRKVFIVEDYSKIIATTAEYSHYLIRKTFTKTKKELIGREILTLRHSPLISVIMPVYNPPLSFLEQALESVCTQFYKNWEICIADDCSTDPEIRKLLNVYTAKYSNIRVIYRGENGHISKATNSALELAKGDFCLLMDQDDLLREDALFEIAKTMIRYPDAELIYSDEDKIDAYNIHSEPHFKPDWSPESLLSRNYLGHICAFKTEALIAIGGYRAGFEGSQDYDLALRFTEIYKHIYHIPEVLYHWRSHSESAASGETAKPYAYRAAQKSITEALNRRGWEPQIDFLNGFRGYKASIAVKDPSQMVSIIIPTKNKQEYLKAAIGSIVSKSTFRNFEIILIDNNSDEKEFFSLVEEYKNQSRFAFKYLSITSPFNFSHLINEGRKLATGKYILLLNNDTEVITPEWLEGMIGYAQNPEIGVVGCKLLYENDTIQHIGVVIGLGGVAAHVLTGCDREGPGYFNYVNLLNNYSAVTAACCMIRAEVFDLVHGFDEKFEVEYNDVDFCLKIVEAGYRNVYVPHVELYHYESISRGHPLANSISKKRHEKEMNMFRKKWPQYVENDPCYNPNLTRGEDNFAIKL